MLIVILGCGRVGARLAVSLDREGHDVRVIDRQPDALQRLPPEFGGTRLIGEGCDVDVLRRAGTDKADIFAAVTNIDSTNVMAAQIAKFVLQVPRVITRIYDPASEATYQALGLETVCPTTLSALLIDHMLELLPDGSTGVSAVSGNQGS